MRGAKRGGKTTAAGFKAPGHYSDAVAFPSIYTKTAAFTVHPPELPPEHRPVPPKTAPVVDMVDRSGDDGVGVQAGQPYLSGTRAREFESKASEGCQTTYRDFVEASFAYSRPSFVGEDNTVYGDPRAWDGGRQPSPGREPKCPENEGEKGRKKGKKKKASHHGEESGPNGAQLGGLKRDAAMAVADADQLRRDVVHLRKRLRQRTVQANGMLACHKIVAMVGEIWRKRLNINFKFWKEWYMGDLGKIDDLKSKMEEKLPQILLTLLSVKLATNMDRLGRAFVCWQMHHKLLCLIHAGRKGMDDATSARIADHHMATVSLLRAAVHSDNISEVLAAVADVARDLIHADCVVCLESDPNARLNCTTRKEKDVEEDNEREEVAALKRRRFAQKQNAAGANTLAHLAQHVEDDDLVRWTFSPGEACVLGRVAPDKHYVCIDDINKCTDVADLKKIRPASQVKPEEADEARREAVEQASAAAQVKADELKATVENKMATVKALRNEELVVAHQARLEAEATEVLKQAKSQAYLILSSATEKISTRLRTPSSPGLTGTAAGTQECLDDKSRSRGASFVNSRRGKDRFSGSFTQGRRGVKKPQQAASPGAKREEAEKYLGMDLASRGEAIDEEGKQPEPSPRAQSLLSPTEMMGDDEGAVTTPGAGPDRSVSLLSSEDEAVDRGTPRGGARKSQTSLNNVSAELRDIMAVAKLEAHSVIQEAEARAAEIRVRPLPAPEETREAVYAESVRLQELARDHGIDIKKHDESMDDASRRRMMTTDNTGPGEVMEGTQFDSSKDLLGVDKDERGITGLIAFPILIAPSSQAEADREDLLTDEEKNAKQRIIAVLLCLSKGPFSKHDLRNLQELSQLASLCVQNAKMAGDQALAIKQLQALTEPDPAAGKQQAVDKGGMTQDALTDRLIHLVGAERGTLFTIDKHLNMLQFMVDTPEGKKTINMELDRNTLCGQSILDNETINITDPYHESEDQRCLKTRAMDAKTGSKTRSILCVPVRGSDGAVVGAMQVLNCRNRPTFNDHDEKLLRAFGVFVVQVMKDYAHERTMHMMQQRFEESAALCAALSKLPTRNKLKHVVLDKVRGLIGCEHVALILVEKDAAENAAPMLRCSSANNFTAETESNDLGSSEWEDDDADLYGPVESALPLGKGVVGISLLQGTVQLVNSPQENRAYSKAIDADPGVPLRNTVCVPIPSTTGPPMGVLQVFLRNLTEFNGISRCFNTCWAFSRLSTRRRMGRIAPSPSVT